MTKTWMFWLAAASGIFLGGDAWAQSNGPITGIPSGLGPNGSVTFVPAPEPPINTGPSIGAPISGLSARGTRSHHPPSRTGVPRHRS
jgi:hypothetical protein